MNKDNVPFDIASGEIEDISDIKINGKAVEVLDVNGTKIKASEVNQYSRLPLKLFKKYIGYYVLP